MKTKIKDEKEAELTFSLTRDEDENINVKVNNALIVQFVNMDEHMDMYTNFESNYKMLSIKKK